MAKVVITETLEKEINKKFKKESIKIFELLLSLEKNPKKGKFLNQLGDIVLKEIKYKSFRFYFITNGFKLKFLKIEELSDLLIKFVRMSDKDSQQEVIEDIKRVLRTIGDGL
ncbi:MAG: hypothetical protein ABIJ20_03425 [Nanoarchaeota archaeon]|nr:hypothetical protein [Nanoarchaeota archaeon]MBU1445440.1 hypothetical protein [Nanoarchaeota archaeon]MBU2420248.1 hypothetical protein [Nanoarchaeota archaeon]MBU2474989.1 hypothetical protein [Nanoarchaeota archaeon]